VSTAHLARAPGLARCGPRDAAVSSRRAKCYALVDTPTSPALRRPPPDVSQYAWRRLLRVLSPFNATAAPAEWNAIEDLELKAGELIVSVGPVEQDWAGWEVGYKLGEKGRTPLSFPASADFVARLGREEAQQALVQVPLRYWIFTPELQWQPRGTLAYLTGVPFAQAMLLPPYRCAAGSPAAAVVSGTI
jgi:hypothetical protein